MEPATARGAEEEGVEAAAPSFRRVSVDLVETAEEVVSLREEDGGEDDEAEFTFAVPSAESFEVFQVVSAEEIFANGQIRAVRYFSERGPVIGDGELLSREGDDDAAEKAIRPAIQRLVLEERETPSASCSTVSSEASDLDGISADSYCLWTPPSAQPPEMQRRCHSAGESKRWRLRDLVIGRSQSDGKKKFIFLEPHHSSASDVVEKKHKERSRDRSGPPELPAIGEEKKKGGVNRAGKGTEMDMSTAHRLFYSKGGAAAGDRRRSYLPYRSHLVGFFGNVNSPQPF